MQRVLNLKIKIFSDGANLDDFRSLGNLEYIKGFTTNPSLMRKAGVSHYAAFIKEVLPLVGTKPISFEVISDQFPEMKRQALKLAELGDNVYVKIPITNTRAETSVPLIAELRQAGVRVNVTAITTIRQVQELVPLFTRTGPMVISVFAGRVADTGVDPVPLMTRAKHLLSGAPGIELLWASSRELLNIFQAESAGCDIITVMPDLLKKLALIGYDLEQYSLDTVKTFYNDALASQLNL